MDLPHNPSRTDTLVPEFFDPSVFGCMAESGLREDSRMDLLLPRGVALALVISVFPVLAVLWGIYFLTDRKGGPFLYRGRRLGKGKRPFTVYKVRTLTLDAEQTLGERLYRGSDGLHTPYGDFLRRTRLDELPQLFNILKGDMNFVGPRPLRPQVYRAHAARIPNYDDRFMVRPGLTGISQLFTPHGTSKRMRAMLDNRYLHSSHGSWCGLGLLVLTAVRVAGNFGIEVWRLFRCASLRVSGVCPDSGFWRATPRYGAWCRERNGVRISTESNTGVEVQDLEEEQLLLRGGVLADDVLEFTLEAPHPRRAGRMLHIRCAGEIVRTGADPLGTGTLTVLGFHPRGDLDQYRLEKYVLKKSIG